MIRIATMEDLDTIVALGSFFFYQDSPYTVFDIDMEKFKAVVTTMLQAPREEKIILLCEVNGEVVGLLAAMIEEFMWSRDKVAFEVAWWISPQYRGTRHGIELLKAYEFWANKMGVKAIQMSNLENGVTANVDRLYKRTQYQPVEHAYLKVVA